MAQKGKIRKANKLQCHSKGWECGCGCGGGGTRRGQTGRPVEVYPMKRMDWKWKCVAPEEDELQVGGCLARIE